jgi:hypothetical protein
VLAAVGLHLLLSSRPSREFALVAAAAGIGFAWDSLLVATGLASYPAGNFAVAVAPHWIIALWALFGTTLNASLRWLKGRPALAGTLGAIGAPLSYYTGYQLGAIEMPAPAIALALQGLGWAIILPALMALAQRLNGFDPAPPALSSALLGRTG